MKKLNWKTIFNPFEKFTERQLFICGLATSVIGSFLFWFFKQSNDGIYHIGPEPGISFTKTLAETTICILLPCVLLTFVGKLINSKTRSIDLLNATMIHRIPLTTGIWIIQLPFIKISTNEIMAAIKNNAVQSLPGSTLWISTLSSMLLLLLFVYAIVLLVNGFKTAVNVKKRGQYVVFAVTLILAEVIYRFLLYPRLSKF
ncbi:MAG: hypothetical protein J7539_08230 [Niabella sp.]|nr:hypothetical protein [Niabella sp.]